MSKTITNKGLLFFIVIFFVLSSIGNYCFLYEGDIFTSISISAFSSILVLSIFIVKRKWDRKQESEFKK